MTLTALKARHEAAGGTPVHLNTFKVLLKGAGLFGSAPDKVYKNAMKWHLHRIIS